MTQSDKSRSRVYRSSIDCAHCAGSGLLVKTDPAKPWIVNWCAGTRTPNAVSRPFPCQFCGGTGRAKPTTAAAT